MTRRRLLAWIATGALIAPAALAAPALADYATAQCLFGDPPHPVVGDGPWAGDAPDDRSTLVIAGCWTGRIHGPDDRDSYQFAANQMVLHILEGCADVGLATEATYDPFDPGTGGGGEKCAPHTQELFIKLEPPEDNMVEIAFYAHEDATADDHTGVYAFEI